MACGNNKITRAYLSSPPTSLTEHIGQFAVHEASAAARREHLATALGQTAWKARRFGEFILPTGQDQALASASERKQYAGRHVHVIPRPDDDPSSVLVQGTDRANKGGWYDHSGHFDNVLLLHNPSRERIEQAKADLLSALNARSTRLRR